MIAKDLRGLFCTKFTNQSYVENLLSETSNIMKRDHKLYE